MVVPDDNSAARANVLVVEDMATVRRLIAALLGQHSFSVTEACDGSEALEHIRTSAFDVVLLDLELPDTDGLDLCRTLRADANTSDAYIVIVSGRTDESDRIRGLDAGADDYVVKPFSPEELVLRVEAMLRRPRRRLDDHDDLLAGDNRETAAATTDDDAIRLVHGSQSALVGDRPIELTRIEFSLLSELVDNAGAVVPRERLIEVCWGASPVDDHHLLSVHVANLRRKVDPDGTLIHTRRGIGYMLAVEATSPAAT